MKNHKLVVIYTIFFEYIGDMKIIFDTLELSNKKEAAKFFKLPENEIVIKEKGRIEIEIAEVVERAVESYYRMETTDTLFSISKKFSVPVSLIKEANEGVIFAGGVVIYIPVVKCDTYIVSPMDTIESISLKFNQDIQKLKERNQLDYLFAGQIILLD